MYFRRNGRCYPDKGTHGYDNLNEDMKVYETQLTHVVWTSFYEMLYNVKLTYSIDV